MAHRSLSLLGAFTLALSLAACGGGGGGGGTSPVFNPATPAPATVSISPTALAFTGAGDTPKSFTVSSSLGGVAAPTVDAFGCGSVVTITTSSSTLPATYTVTPTGNGSCSFVMNVGTASAAIGITVGGASVPSISQSATNVNIFVGGTAGSVTVSASSGTLVADTRACNGIASIGQSGGGSSQTFTIAPVTPGSCTLTIVDGASSVSVPIVVNANPGGANALTIAPSTLTFSGPNAGPQQAVLGFTGNAGSVSINEDDCIGLTGKPKIAYLVLTGVPAGSPVTLPQNVTVTPYGTASGSCSIVFTSSAGAAQAVLSVVVQ